MGCSGSNTKDDDKKINAPYKVKCHKEFKEIGILSILLS